VIFSFSGIVSNTIIHFIHVLISPNAFKNVLNAEEAGEAIRQALMLSKLSCICESFPIGDGGDGTGHLKH
jgi:glycerate kinase